MKCVRYLCFMIALLLCLAMPASAETITDTAENVTVDAEAPGLLSSDELFEGYAMRALQGEVASVTVNGNTTNYPSLNTALKAWTDGGTLTLLTDCKDSGQIVTYSGNTYTLNLNGHTLEWMDRAQTVIYNQGYLTINGPGSIKGCMVLDNLAGGTLTINNVDIISEKVDYTSGVGIIATAGTTKLTGGTTIDAKNDFGVFSAGYLDLSEMGSAVNGMTIQAYETLDNFDKITLPPGYCLWRNNEPITSLEYNKKATIGVAEEAQTYSITVNVNDGSCGTATASETTAAADAKIMLNITPKLGYTYSCEVKTDNDTLPVTDNSFTMPAANVTVDVVFSECTHENTTFVDNKCECDVLAVAQVEDTCYADFNTAIEAWESKGGVLTLLAGVGDAAFEITGQSANTYTMKGNGQNVAPALTFKGDAAFTLENCTPTSIAANQSTVVLNHYTGGNMPLTLENGGAILLTGTLPACWYYVGSEENVLNADVEGLFNTAGTYTLTVNDKHTFDRYDVDDEKASIALACICSERKGDATLVVPTNAVYNGTAHSASADVTGGLTATITYQQGATALDVPPANAGTYSASMTVGNESVSKEFTIAPKELTATATISDVAYNTDGQYTLTVASVTFGGLVNGETLTIDRDYTAAAAMPENFTNEAGTVVDGVTVTVEMKNGNYTLGENTIIASVKISAHSHSWGSYTADDAADTITATCGCGQGGTVRLVLPEEAPVYDGVPHGISYETTDSDLVPQMTYKKDGVEAEPINAGKYEVTMMLDGVEVDAEFEIKPKNIQSCSITGTAEYAYTGEVPELDIAVTDGERMLIKGTDYKVELTGFTAGPQTMSIIGMGNYVGERSDFTIKITPASISGATVTVNPSAFIYTGGEIKPDVTVVLSNKTLVKDMDFTVTYSNNVHVGDATVTVTGTGNYKDTVEKTFAISKSDAVVTATADKAEYTYGDAITVTATVAAAPAALSLREAPAANQMALFLGEKQISDAVDAVDGTYTMVCNTTDKQLPVGENILTVKYVAGDNMNDAAAEVKITLKARELIVTGAAAEDRAYKPDDTSVKLVSVTLDGGVGEDTVTLDITNLTGSVASADAGTYYEITLPALMLTGDHAGYYILTQPADVPGSVTISPLAVALEHVPTAPALDAYYANAEDIIAQLTKTVAYVADGKEHVLSVSWALVDSVAGSLQPDMAYSFKWTVNNGGNYTIKENDASGIVRVKNGSALPVAITPANKEITYDGDTFDVSELFIIDGNAGEATYSIVAAENAGAGTLDGTTLTITKAGVITIQVNTAAKMGEDQPYAAGEATATLTVSKGTPAQISVPAGLTAKVGQTLADVTLPTHWRWKEPTASVGNAGEKTFVAIFTPGNTALWNTVEQELNVAVGKADVTLEGSAATYLGDIKQTSFTYGQIITVKATPDVLSLRTEPAANQMALFCGEKQISPPADADDNGAYTMTYNTTDKQLPIGESTITVRYVGNENLNDASAALKVTITKAMLTITGVTVEDRPYKQGDKSVAVGDVNVTGVLLETDDVSVDVTALRATVSSDAAGDYNKVTLPVHIALKGAHAQYYALTGGNTLAANVSITKVAPTPAMSDTQPRVDKPYTSGITLADLTPSLPDGAFNVPGTLRWAESLDTVVERGKSYGWVFTPNDTTNYSTYTGSMVIYALPTRPPVVVTPMPSPVPTPVVTPEPIILPVVSQPTEDQYVLLGDGSTVIMTVAAANADSYQWYVKRSDGMDFQPVSGANKASLSVTVTEGDDGNRYFCRITNPDGSVNSPVFTLEVRPAVVVPPTGDDSQIMLWAALLLMSAAGLLMIEKIRVSLG